MLLIEQIALHLVNQGLGQLASTIFYSYLPDNADNALCVYDTGGMEPDIDLPTKVPTFQIIVRASDYETGKTKLDAVRTALHRKEGATLINGGTFFYYIFAMQEGGHIGRNERGLDEFSINFRTKIR